MAQGVKPSTIRNALMPLRAIYRYALTLDEVGVNPTTGVQLPAVRGRRERIASPTEAASLIAALPSADRAVWATAMYAGLRAGELQALRDGLIDLDRNVIQVHWSWDPKAGRVTPKSRAGRRTADPEDPAAPPGRAPPRPPRPRRAVLRPHGRAAVLQPGLQPARRARLGGSQARPDRPAQLSPHVRIADDRGGSQRKGPIHLHGPRLDHGSPSTATAICSRAPRRRPPTCSTPTSSDRRRARDERRAAPVLHSAAQLGVTEDRRGSR